MTTSTTDGSGTPSVTSTEGPLSSSTGCTTGCSPTLAVSKTDSRPRLAGRHWYAERDIDRRAFEFINRYTEGCSPAHYDDNNYYGRASEFIDRVHHGMLAGAGGEQDG
uniref:Uncharacterized protein n=1 Tax=Oryza barthii TaxID=65489 RepID=A0A0D3EM95_9ORYZ